MKNLLIFILMLTARAALADIVVHKSAMSGYYYCDITPYLCDVCGGDTATQLSINIVSDNAVDECEIYWVLYSSTGSNRWNGNIAIVGSTYRDLRGVDCSADSFARAKFLYNYVHSVKPAIAPIP